MADSLVFGADELPPWFEAAHASTPRRAGLLLAGLVSGVVVWALALPLALACWAWLSRRGLPAGGLSLFHAGGAILAYVVVSSAHEASRWLCRPLMARRAIAILEPEGARLYRPEGLGLFWGGGIGDYPSRSWDRVAGYRDDHAGWVELIATNHRRGRFLMIPTPTSTERAQALEFLEGRGLTRLSS